MKKWTDIDYNKEVETFEGSTVFEDVYISGELFYNGNISGDTEELAVNIGIVPDVADGAYVGTVDKPFSEGHFGNVKVGVGDAGTRGDGELTTSSGHLYLTSSTEKIGINCQNHWIHSGSGLTNSDNKPQATLDIEGNVLISDNATRGEVGGTGNNMIRGGFPHPEAQLHIHGTRDDGSNNNGRVPFESTVQVTISTGCIDGGGQGYLGRLNFGTSDHPAIGGQTTQEYNWASACIAGNAGATDTTDAAAASNLEFWTKNDTTALTKHFVIAEDGTLLGTDTSIGNISDSRLKKNVEDFTYDVDKFKQFKTRTFDWKHPELHGEKSEVRGFIAQEIENIDPKLMGTTEVNNDTLDYQYLEDGISKTSKLGEKDAMYISVIQQLIAKIEILETKVATLESA